MSTRSRLVLVTLLATLGVCPAPQAWCAGPAEYVIHVSCDGLRGDLLSHQLAATPPTALGTFHRLVAEGATTFNARADFTHTTTLPNHTCMLTGLPVARPPGGSATSFHGWTKNRTPREEETLHGTGNPSLDYVHSIFDVVHDAGLTTALYASKTKFILFDRSWDADHGAADQSPPDNGRDKIDRYVCIVPGADRSATLLQARLLRDMRSNPAHFTFVHYADPDLIGHEFGWGSSPWMVALARVDAMLGELLDVVDADPRLAGHTVVVVTADHGGEGTNHSDPKRVEDCTIPFLVWGVGVAHGADLYTLNPGVRRDPGRRRPPTEETPPPIRNGDAANLELRLLGLGPVPGSTIGVRQDLRVEPASEPLPRATDATMPVAH